VRNECRAGSVAEEGPVVIDAGTGGRPVTERRWFILLVFAGLTAALSAASAHDVSYDLRDYGTVTPVRNQGGCGSCWCFGTMASLESNLLMTGNWQHDGQPDLSENHLNWHHGFDPIPACQGGDYRMTAAYFSRGSGPVLEADAPYHYSVAPPEDLPVHYYVGDIEWYDTADEIKTAIENYGVVSTCVSVWSTGTGGGWQNDAFYTAPDGNPGNHSVGIVGWDDTWVTKAPNPGAWRCKNSWGSGWSGDGYFGIAYEDRNAGHDPEMGAVSFHNVTPASHRRIYYHDDHGWCAEKNYAYALNAFTASARELLSAVSFYTTADAVDYEVRVYGSFSAGDPGDLRGSVSGTMSFRGFHTIDLPYAISLDPGEAFYLYLRVSNGEQAIDCTVEKGVLMAPEQMTGYIIASYANPGESFYSTDGTTWSDLYDEHPDHSANFTIKGITYNAVPEPISMIFFGTGLVGVFGFVTRRKMRRN